MDRKVIVGLLRNGMKYPVGRHQIWISCCFEITVHPNKVVEVDEYEAYDEKKGLESFNGSRASVLKDHVGKYHIGRSVIHLKDNRVIESEAGLGWIRPSHNQHSRNGARCNGNRLTPAKEKCTIG